MDPRFSKLASDPRFVRPKAAKNKLVLDDRFKQFFDDSDPSTSDGKGKGSKKNKVDKYGRPLEAEAKTNELKRYYRMEEPAVVEADSKDDDEDSEDAQEEGVPATTFIDRARGAGGEESSDEEQDEDESNSDSEGSVTLAPSSLLRRRRASPSRSPSIDLSESGHPFQSGSEAEDAESEDEGPTVEPTKRLAVVNMDWDHLRASDLFRVLASSLSATALPPPAAAKPSKSANKKFDAQGEEIGPYKPQSRLNLAQGRLLSLKIYPSTYGAEKMEQEAREGPPKAVFAGASAGRDGEESDEDEEDVDAVKMKRKPSKKSKARKQRDDSEEYTERDIIREQVEEGAEDYDGEALRQYQLQRLRYYYAVATFDSIASASHVYGEIDGTEFERTANVFDLQFVPDETSFKGDVVHDEATEATVAAAGPDYQGLEFVTDALRHSKVTLTWDADDPHRKRKIQSYLALTTDAKGKGKAKGSKAPVDADILAYLASSSDDDDDDDKFAAALARDDEDDFFESSTTNTTAAAMKKSARPVKGKRDALRSLFGLDGGTGSRTTTSWDGGKVAKKGEGGMEITFAPALTDRRRGGDADDGSGEDDEEGGRVDGRDESAIETYKRKEKERRERKKLERKAKRDGVVLPAVGEEGPEFGGEDAGPGGFDDDFFAESKDTAADAFAAFDAGDDLGADGRKKVRDTRSGGGKVEEAPRFSKKERREAKEAKEEEDRLAQAELALLLDSDSDDDPERAGKHFDMRAILKAEKNKGRKRLGKGGRKPAGAEESEKKDDFVIDVKDDRFKGVYEDSNYAIDPTNPRFQKSRNMDALLVEGQKRRSNKRDARAPVGLTSLPEKKSKAGNDSEDWRKLSEAVKRKAADVGGRGKRAKA